MNANEKQTLTLPAGNVLTITAAAGVTGLVVRLPQSPGGGDAQSVTPIAGANLTFGPYALPERFSIVCTAGTITLSMAAYDPASDATDTELAAALALKLNKAGTATNDSAASGAIGEVKSTTVAIDDKVLETTGTPVDVATLVLTPGDWEVSGVINRDLAGVTATVYGGAISPAADTMPAQAGGSGVGPDSSVIQAATFGTTVTGNYITAIGPVRVSLAANATIHLVAADTFSAGTIGLFGTLRARRVR